MNVQSSNPLLKRAISFDVTGEATMNLNGAVHKTGILLLICIATASYGWMNPSLSGPLLIGGLLGGLVACLVGTFMPRTAPIAAPVYAALEGLVLGVISQYFNRAYPGIAANAILLTFSVLGLFLFLYATRIVQVTNGMRVAIFAATLGVLAVYAIDLLLGLFGISMPLIHSSGWLGIGVSLLICGIAAFNFFLDFDAIERTARAGAPKYMEWYFGMALLVTLVWLYLEILRLLAKLQNRR